MRLELFAKDTSAIVTHTKSLIAYNGVRGLNIPHKTKYHSPLAALEALEQSGLPPSVLRECVPHYSLKFAYGGSVANALKGFSDFCEAAAALKTPPRELHKRQTHAK